MANEQLIKLLEEIRDLQKLHVENYKDALKNQQESIAIQKRGMRRQIRSLIILVIFLACILIWLFFFSSRSSPL